MICEIPVRERGDEGEGRALLLTGLVHGVPLAEHEGGGRVEEARDEEGGEG